jgi:glyoxylase-like metal-dependent hydrolase (beta-lactamase superfamily II)
MADDRLYFRQLLAGRDFARHDQVARQMVNFVYLIGDRQTGEAVAVDPAYDIKGLLQVLEGDDMRLVGALATHYHPDHIGGDMMGYRISGIRELLTLAPVPVHIQADEQPWVSRVVDVGPDDLVTHSSGDVVRVGEVPITLIHTPGHTPGSQCFLVDHHLVAQVPDDAVLYPGHLYSADSSATMGDTRRHNFVFAPRSAEEWLRMFGA